MLSKQAIESYVQAGFHSSQTLQQVFLLLSTFQKRRELVSEHICGVWLALKGNWLETTGNCGYEEVSTWPQSWNDKSSVLNYIHYSILQSIE